MLNPILVARTHVLRLPAYLASCRQKLLLLIKDTNEPLSCMQVLDWCTAAFMCANDMLNHALFQYQAHLSQCMQDTLPGLRNLQTGTRACQRGHMPIAPNRGP